MLSTSDQAQDGGWETKKNEKDREREEIPVGVYRMQVREKKWMQKKTKQIRGFVCGGIDGSIGAVSKKIERKKTDKKHTKMK